MDWNGLRPCVLATDTFQHSNSLQDLTIGKGPHGSKKQSHLTRMQAGLAVCFPAGGIYNQYNDYTLAHRHRLVELAKDDPKMDIGFSGTIQCNEVCEEMKARYGASPIAGANFALTKSII